jgi:hypothetical protein
MYKNFIGFSFSFTKLERFLQLADDDYTSVNINRTERLKRQVRNCNWQVVVCTTTVNYFHALRRQLRRDFRKPLIVLSSKKLLRHKGVNHIIYFLHLINKHDINRLLQICPSLKTKNVFLYAITMQQLISPPRRSSALSSARGRFTTISWSAMNKIRERYQIKIIFENLKTRYSISSQKIRILLTQ